MSVAIPSLRGAIAVPEWAKNELWRKARVVPSLDLRFADLKSLVDATTGTNLVTFARGSGGTYVGSDGLIKTATTNEPRFTHDPVAGESLGLLVEEQRVNLLQRTEEFDDVVWAKTAATVTANATQSPDGLVNADKLVENNSSATHFVRQNVTGVIGTVYTSSVFAKAGERNRLVVSHFDGGTFSGVQVDLSTGTASSPPSDLAIADASATALVEEFQNGWYRISLTRTQASTTTVQLRAAIVAGSNGVYTGDGTSGVYLGKAQLEVGSFPTSYIRNFDTALGVTRQPDLCQISGSNFSSWYNASEGTVFAEAAVANTSVNRFIASFSDGTISEEISLYWAAAFSSLVNDGGVSQANSFGGTVSAGAKENHSFAFKVNDFQGYANGVALLTDTSGTLPTVDRLTIGSRANSTFIANGTISRLAYWPQRLPNSTLQAITL